MPDYKTMYLTLFRAMTKAEEILKDAQLTAEQLYIKTAPYLSALDEVDAAESPQKPCR